MTTKEQNGLDHGEGDQGDPYKTRPPSRQPDNQNDHLPTDDQPTVIEQQNPNTPLPTVPDNEGRWDETVVSPKTGSSPASGNVSPNYDAHDVTRPGDVSVGPVNIDQSTKIHKVGQAGLEVWGDFEIHEKLGEGGMGTVYKGRQISLDRWVAIKVLPEKFAADSNFLRRFELEAKTVARIYSPHVVHVIAAGKHGDKHYFAMEFVRGEDLASKLESGYIPTFGESVDIIQQAARGLAAANEFDLIHRDIKPANLMITDKNRVKITDFGLVKVLSGESTALTMVGTTMGTVSYFSPEQGAGDYCDQRTDIYALGVVLYQLITGDLPFTGDNPNAIIYQHNFVQPKHPREIVPDIPEDLEHVVLKCMEKKPDKRYQDANELIGRVRRVETPPTTIHQRPGTFSERRAGGAS